MLPVRNRNSWLSGVLDDSFDTGLAPRLNSTAPVINVIAHDGDYIAELVAPGLRKDDFVANIDNNGNLTIKTKKKAENKEEGKKAHYLYREFSYSSFEQALILPDDADKERICAKMSDGVLTVTLPKREEIVQTLGKQITVEQSISQVSIQPQPCNPNRLWGSCVDENSEVFLCL